MKLAVFQCSVGSTYKGRALFAAADCVNLTCTVTKRLQGFFRLKRKCQGSFGLVLIHFNHLALGDGELLQHETIKGIIFKTPNHS